MELLKTFYKGCDSVITVDPNNSFTIRMSEAETYCYQGIMSILNEVFMIATLNHYEKVTNEPYKVSLILPDKIYLDKFKPKDADTILERIYWIIDNYEDPPGGIIISVYSNKNMLRLFESQWAVNSVWNFKKKWDGSESDYVTIQSTHEKLHGKEENNKFYIMCNLARRTAKELGYEVIDMDYTTPIQKVYELLLSSKLHLGAYTATSFLTSSIGAPFLHFGWKLIPEKNIEIYKSVYDKPWEYTHNIFENTSTDLLKKIEKSSITKNIFNDGTGAPLGKTFLFHSDSKLPYLDNPLDITGYCYAENEIQLLEFMYNKLTS